MYYLRYLRNPIRAGAFLLLIAVLASCAAIPPAITADAGATAQDAVSAPTLSLPAAEATPTTTQESAAAPADDEDARPAGWTEETHSNDVDPNYAVVFPQDKVNELTITIAPEQWAAMQADMTELYGAPGTRGGPGGGPPMGMAPPAGFEPPAPGELPEGAQPPAGGQPPAGFAPPQGMPGGGPGDFTTENPMWVDATIEFDGNTWTHVGVRYKGNSSLMSSWNSGSRKLPFKFDFDEFEDEYPEIDNQRFYGFKQLSLANGFSDATFMRDALTYDLLDAAGLVAAETAFYHLYLDYGEGPVDLGVYTAIEVIDDTVVARAFGDDDGNLYEGDGRGVSLAEGTFDQIESSFQKENNEDAADWSDIEALYTVLHAETRLTDPETWRAELETVFDVDTFLEWLAISAVIGHWDTYGAMSHNFYLYNDPATGQLTWISWDHNMTMGGSMGGGPDRPPGGENAGGNAGAPPNRGPGGMSRSASLDKADVGADWPLIRYLLDDPTYYADYLGYMAAFSTDIFTPERIAAQVQAMAELLTPYAAPEIGATEFDAAVQQLIDFADARAGAVATFLSEQGQE